MQPVGAQGEPAGLGCIVSTSYAGAALACAANPLRCVVADWSFAFARHTEAGEAAYRCSQTRLLCLSTQRAGGASTGAFASLNLSAGQGDEVLSVTANRAALQDLLPWPAVYMRLDHGCALFDADRYLSHAAPSVPVADAAVLTRKGISLVMLTADCLPVVIADTAGRGIAIAHAGWRGLAAGVIETACRALQSRLADTHLMAWIGPGIGPAAFEVQADVIDRFPGDERGTHFFRPRDARRFPGKWLGDLPAIARKRCRDLGISRVGGGLWCTWHDEESFFSYRRQGRSGRMATAVALR